MRARFGLGAAFDPSPPLSAPVFGVALGTTGVWTKYKVNQSRNLRAVQTEVEQLVPGEVAVKQDVAESNATFDTSK
jgi:hypothetical protein